MTAKKKAPTAKKGETKAVVKVSPTVKQATADEAVNNAELVNEAGINVSIEEKPAPKKTLAANRFVSSDTIILNTSQNPILLTGDTKEETILIGPREIKRVNRALLKKLMQNKIIRNWFDKGILTTNQDENETSVHEAIVPDHLSQPVERHDGANVSASVTKFEKQGSMNITLS